MFPYNEIGTRFSHLGSLNIGDELVVMRGTGNYFFGRVAAVKSRPVPGMFSPKYEVTLRVVKYYYRMVLQPTFPPTKVVEESPRTEFYRWLSSNQASSPVGGSPPQPPPSPTSSGGRKRTRAPNPSQVAAEARRASRRAYVSSMDLLAKGRDELLKNLQELGVSHAVSSEDLKNLRRRVMLEWHPDREQLFVQSGKGTVSQFQEVSQRKVMALAFVAQYISRRDGSSVT